MNRPLRVQFEHTRFPHWGGHSGFHQLARHLDPGAFRAELHGAPDNHEDFPRVPEAVGAWLKRRIQAGGMSWYKLSDLKAEMRLLPACLKGELDVVHFLDGEHAGQYLPRALKAMGRRRPVTVATFHQPPSVLPDVIDPRVVAAFDHVTLVSPSQLPFFQGLVPEERLHVILHGIDTEFFRPPPARQRGKRLRCVTVGHWLRDWTAMRAVAGLLHDDPDIEFDLVTGAETGLEGMPRVRKHAGLSDEALADLYRQADVLLLPLTDATANNALLEGIACGLPVVSSDIEAVRAYTPGGEAIRVKGNDPAALAAALQTLRDEPDRRLAMGRLARARAEELSWPVQAALHGELYARALERDLPKPAPIRAPAPAPTGRLFCSKPFTWFEVSRGAEEGEAYMCCPAWLDTPIGNLTRQSVDEVWNGETAQSIRRSVLDGSFSYCNARRCPHLQRVDGPVSRVEDVTDARMLEVLARELTVVPYGPRDINCSFDRSCNLSCPSCRTQLIMETKSADRITGLQRTIETQALKDAELLYITGSGDPFGSPYFRKWLQTMKRENMPKLKRLHLHSNGLLWTPRIWESIPGEIRALVRSCDISIDAATPATYAENRRGGEFDILLERLEFIARLRREGPLEWFGINMTVQANNFREMTAFAALGRRFGADVVSFAQITNWGTFSAEEFAARAVHKQEHPEHAEFRRVLADPALHAPGIYLSNLSDLSGRAAAEVALPW